MDTNIQEIIQSQWGNLPKGLKEAILDAQFSAQIKTIAGESSLNEDQTESLLLETTLVMIGLEYSKNYLRNIRNNLGLSDQITRTIGLKISDTIFKPVSEDLRGLNEKMELAQITDESETAKSGTAIPIKNLSASTGSQTPKTLGIPTPMSRQGLDMPAQTNFVGEMVQPATIIDRGAVPIKNIIDDKLNNIVKLPKEEKFVDALAREKGYTGIDPYREPIQ